VLIRIVRPDIPLTVEESSQYHNMRATVSLPTVPASDVLFVWRHD
jgi:hypothetical protein